MLKPLRSLSLLLLICLLAACGNKGDLVKPGTTPAPAKSEAGK
jgi:predicted small lipoprotein YifL